MRIRLINNFISNIHNNIIRTYTSRNIHHNINSTILDNIISFTINSNTHCCIISKYNTIWNTIIKYSTLCWASNINSGIPFNNRVTDTSSILSPGSNINYTNTNNINTHIMRYISSNNITSTVNSNLFIVNSNTHCCIIGYVNHYRFIHIEFLIIIWTGNINM